MENPIPEKKIKSQAWKFYAVLIAWPAYLFILPWVYSRIGLYSLVFMVFPGAYLFVWVGVLAHECWHKYVPNVPNNLLYTIYSYLMVTDPQMYKILHGFHHSKVNTWDDTEFHPFGRIENENLRRMYNFLEIVFGIPFITFSYAFVIPRHEKFKDKFKRKSQVTAVIMWLLVIGALEYGSMRVFGLVPEQVIIPFAFTYLIGGSIFHHFQLVEHGNLIVEGDFKVRNIKTRNLSAKGIIEKIFLFLTHDDAREHVLHHTMASVYTRPFIGSVPMPEQVVYITLRDYAKILWQMVSVG